MATYSVNYAKHATLSSNTVDAVTLNNPTSFILILNRSASGNPIYYTYGDPEKGVTAPTVAGDDSYHVGVGQTVSIPADGTTQLVKLISTSAQKYSVLAV